MKKLLSLLLAVLSVLPLTGCSKKEGTENDSEMKTLKVAVLESAYGNEMWEEVCDNFEEMKGNVNVELTSSKNLEDVISAKMKSGDYPDYVHLATGREAALTETLVKDSALEELTDVLGYTVPGEDVTVGDKLTEGFTDTLATNPYSDNKT